MNSNKRSIVILGGTGGIGSAVARRAASTGADVAIVARGRERLDSLAAEVDALPIQADATDFGAVEEAVKEAAAEFGQLDGIVNCVGSILLKAAHQTSEDEWRQTLAANLDTSFAAVRAAAKVMRKNGGSVVLMASSAARVGLPSHEAIAAAKAGVIGLGRSAAATYASAGIRFNVVAPGLVETPMSEKITGNPLMLKASEAMHPLGRIGRPDEVASMIEWLLSDDSQWVTGQIFGLDGGMSTVRSKTSA